MRKFIGYMLLALLLNSSTLWADDGEKKKPDVCATYHELATMVMSARQKGVSLVKMMGIAGDEMTKSLVMSAYDKPQYSGEEYRTKAVEEFANERALMCYKERGKK